MPDLGNTSVFSQTDGSNNSGTQPSWSGSAAPSTLDDAGRGLQGAVTREWNWRNFTLTAGGTADAKTLTYSVAPAAYYNGQRFAFIANTTNTGSATLNVNSLGAKTIKKDLSGTLTNLSASDMVSGMFVEVVYNTANDCFVWVNRGAIPTLGALASLNTVGTSQIDDLAVTTAKIAANAVDGTKIALGSDAQGDVMYYNGTDWARLAAGTSGHFLKTNGAGANPAWAALGSLTVLGQVAMNVANPTLSGLTLTDYNGLFIVFYDLNHSAGANRNVLVGTSTSDDVQMTGSLVSGTVYYGMMWINFAAGGAAAILNTAGGSSQLGACNVTTITGSATSVSFALSGSGSFSGGTTVIYGWK